MTVKELREMLTKFPDDMPIAYSLHSEWSAFDADELVTGELFENGGYLSRVYQPQDRQKARTYLMLT